MSVSGAVFIIMGSNVHFCFIFIEISNIVYYSNKHLLICNFD